MTNIQELRLSLNIDRQQHAAKPSPEELQQSLRSRLGNSQREGVTVDELAEAIAHGQTITPALMSGTKGDSWRSQQIIAADIDNDYRDENKVKKPLENPLLPEEALEVLRKHGIDPALMYSTFSNKPDWPKFRVLVALAEPIQDKEEARDLTERLANILNEAREGCTDTSIKDAARLLFGGAADCILYKGKTAAALETMRELPPARAQRPEPDPVQRQRETPQPGADEDAKRAYILEALEAVPVASLSRDDWIHVGMALKAEGFDCDTWDYWSRNDNRYKAGECAKIWRGFKGAGITVATIIKLAQGNGWQPSQRVKQLYVEAHKIPAAEDFSSVPLELYSPIYEPDEAERQAEEDQQAAEAVAQAEQAEAEQREAYSKESNLGHMDAFLEAIEKSKTNPAIPTGFSSLDALLDGGLYAGLYVLGAITSLGKTTFALQVADNIAASGHDVIYIALEMSRQELIAKSISRLTWQIASSRGLKGAALKRHAKTVRGILAGKKFRSYSPEELEIMAAAMDKYKSEMGSRVWIHEGVGDIGVWNVRSIIEKHIKITGRLPVLFVDYAQILAPVDMRASDKQNTDKAVLELKRLSRDTGIPVICISSLNRDNYTQPINLTAFKESGSLEYGSDCLLGLQFYGMDYKEGEADKAREKRIRELVKTQKKKGNDGNAELLQLKILKNRNGRSGTEALLAYYPMFNTYSDGGFIEVDSSEAEEIFGEEKTPKPLK